MEICVNYDDYKMLVDKYGFEGLLDFVRVNYPEYDIYKISQDWYYEGNRYILRCIGMMGDIVFMWN